MQTALVVALWVLSTIVALFIGGFLKPYLSKKGENLATKEDIRDIVEQMKLITRAAEEIKTELSDAAWDRQKHWELKRDTIFETARKVADETEAMTRLVAIYSTEKMNAEKGLPERMDARIEVGAAWNDAAASLEGMHILVAASCGQELVKAVGEYALFMRALSEEVKNGKPEAFYEKSNQVATRSQAIIVAIRKELEKPK
jgi:hypothetical protein